MATQGNRLHCDLRPCCTALYMCLSLPLEHWILPLYHTTTHTATTCRTHPLPRTLPCHTLPHAHTHTPPPLPCTSTHRIRTHTHTTAHSHTFSHTPSHTHGGRQWFTNATYDCMAFCLPLLLPSDGPPWAACQTPQDLSFICAPSAARHCTSLYS